MPSRPFILGILLFWFGTMGWMFYREYLPRFGAGEPPPFHIDLADEVGGQVILWDVFQKEERIGSGQTKINRNQDRVFELRNDILFSKMDKGPVQFKKMSSLYRITTKGDLLSFVSVMKFEIIQIQHEARFKGEVQDGMLTPKLTLIGPLLDKGPLLGNFLPREFAAVKVPKTGSLLNVLHPQSKIPGLFEGKTWTVPTYDPLVANMSEKMAIVGTGELAWDGGVFPCWRIDVAEPGTHAEPGKQPDYRIWVRRSDDLVLQQEARNQSIEMTLKRVNTK
jgi:hypothetical protein